MGDHFVGLEASWEIDVWGKIRNMKNAEKSRFLASQEGRNLLITNIIATVADLYYELIALDNELRIIQKNIELQNTAVIMIKLQKQGGNVNELAVKQFNAQLLNTQALEFVKTQEIIEVKNQLNFLCGNFDFVKELGENRELINLDNEISLSNVQKTLYNRPDVKMAEMNLKASGYDVKVARALYYPSLSVDAYGGVSSFNTALLLSTPASLAYSLAGGLVAPLFNQNRIKANHKRSIALNREYFQEYRKTVLSSYLEITNLYFKRENIKKIFELKSREVDELKSAVKIANELFNVGYANYLEVVTAQKMVLESELQLIRAQKAINSTLIEIYRATGGGL
jgi:outer membrane protein TolC